jgi:hypothetical protein
VPVRPCVVLDPGMLVRSLHENREISCLAAYDVWSGPHREDEESKPMKNEQEKSDLFIVAMKPANKPGRPGAESMEPRERTEGNTGEQHTCRTPSRASVSQRLDRVRKPLWA